jgi:hypothetical protein
MRTNAALLTRFHQISSATIIAQNAAATPIITKEGRTMRRRSCSISASVVGALRKLIRLTARTVPVASTITLAIITHRVTVMPKKIHSGLVTPLEFSSSHRRADRRL